MYGKAIGDSIAWSDRAEGEPRTRRFEIPGCQERCPSCGSDIEGFVLVQFDGDLITGYREATEEDMESFDW
ncbi:hypothetical protein [Streptomyces sp. NBC_00102]|uniref:hypothetical protein n=1 Tax=Streptomyces sp. NBC_00102 TaxID=2975652 RepID=UPI00225941BB|nr:hypothetical protein [Streptomyces sp. NBC_00102]MCX5400942.1 hypothetical protein [Streptomyces sp. NBC_00102]